MYKIQRQTDGMLVLVGPDGPVPGQTKVVIEQNIDAITEITVSFLSTGSKDMITIEDDMFGDGFITDEIGRGEIDHRFK